MRKLSRIVEELVPEYLEARRNELPRMAALLAASDYERLRILSHSLKGSGGSFGFPELSGFGAELERHASGADGVQFAEELTKLRNYLEQLNWSPAPEEPAHSS